MRDIARLFREEQSSDLFFLLFSFLFFPPRLTPTESNEEIVTSPSKTDSHLWKSMVLNEPGTRLKDAL